MFPFQVTSSKDGREWTLHVKSPQARDTGIYECQVNTEPKMSMAFQLNIIGKCENILFLYIYADRYPNIEMFMKFAFIFVHNKACIKVAVAILLFLIVRCNL